MYWDLGVNYSSPLNGVTFLWMKDYLEEISKRFGDENKIKFYQWCLTNDACSMTVEPRYNSDRERCGHIFSQFYLLSKNQFDAKGIYPLQGENEFSEALFIPLSDLELKEASEHRKKFDLGVIRELLKRSSHQAILGLSGNDVRIYRVRQEHCVTTGLLGAFNTVFEDRKWPKVRCSEFQHRPFVIHKMSEINMFTKNVFVTWSRWA